VDRNPSVVTPARFAQGMTFQQYVAHVATPENLQREGSQAPTRVDQSGFLRDRYQKVKLTEAQTAMIKWLAAQPGGPAKILVISEEWSSDCRRDVPAFARLAEAGGLELRIFARDGKKMSRSNRPMPDESPNADLMAELLNEKNGQTFQSIPVAVFYDKDLRELYRYVEFPACYHKDRIRGHQTSARPGESAEQTTARATKEFATMLASPMLDVWSSAAIDEILSMLYERAVVGSLAK
jgi:thiol-disulfide isomerase/thioredoxin